MPDVSVLNVLLHGHKIGTLTYLGGERTVFAFTDDYIANPQRQTLSLSFKDQNGDLITDHRPYKIKLLPFFSNLLPEGHLRRYLAERVDIHPTVNSSSCGCWGVICPARLSSSRRMEMHGHR